jgi:hypothetical protein
MYKFGRNKFDHSERKQKETILKLGNPLKSMSKFIKYKIGWGASPYQSFTMNSLGAL